MIKNNERRQAFDKVMSAPNPADLTETDIALALDYGIRNGLIDPSQVDKQLLTLTETVNQPESTVGKFAHDVIRKAIEEATLGAVKPDRTMLPGAKLITDVLGTVLGSAPLGIAAATTVGGATVPMLARLARLGALGAGTGTLRGVIEKDTPAEIAKQAVVEGATFAASEPLGKAIARLLSKKGATITEQVVEPQKVESGWASVPLESTKPFDKKIAWNENIKVGRLLPNYPNLKLLNKAEEDVTAMINKMLETPALPPGVELMQKQLNQLIDEAAPRAWAVREAQKLRDIPPLPPPGPEWGLWLSMAKEAERLRTTPALPLPKPEWNMLTKEAQRLLATPALPPPKPEWDMLNKEVQRLLAVPALPPGEQRALVPLDNTLPAVAKKQPTSLTPVEKQTTQVMPVPEPPTVRIPGGLQSTVVTATAITPRDKLQHFWMRELINTVKNKQNPVPNYTFGTPVDLVSPTVETKTIEIVQKPPGGKLTEEELVKRKQLLSEAIEEQLRREALMKKELAQKVYENMLKAIHNDLYREAFNAKGKKDINDIARAIAARYGYDFDLLAREAKKPLEAHLRDIKTKNEEAQNILSALVQMAAINSRR